MARPTLTIAARRRPAGATKLWKWARSVGGQKVTHIGDQEATSCWQAVATVAEMTLKEFVADTSGLADDVHALMVQYNSFTGRATRRTARTAGCK